ncbi:MAG: hypothetical protein VB070_10450 [Clostridiaceae bacterium]|nr:hypothetical protein [Clostridiaceae bacterium]
MKKKKLLLLISIVAVFLVGVASISYAATTYSSPAEIVAGLTGKSIDEVAAARQTGTSYGAQAADAGKLAEFQTSRLDNYKQRLDQAVADQKMTQDEADRLYETMKLRMADCTGDGAGQGAGNGAGQGRGSGGRGMGRNAGNGSGLGFGSGCANCTGAAGN